MTPLAERIVEELEKKIDPYDWNYNDGITEAIAIVRHVDAEFSEKPLQSDKPVITNPFALEKRINREEDFIKPWHIQWEEKND